MARVRQRRVPAVLALALLLISSAPRLLPGQTFRVIHSFSNGSTGYPPTNVDGIEPLAGLTLSINTLYGTTFFGGGSGNGTVFSVNIDGTGFTVLHSFTALDPNGFGNTDGAWPESILTLSGNTLYGTTSQGGSSGCCNGTVFSLDADGTGFVTLYNFSPLVSNPPPINADGIAPVGGVILSGTTLYGTTTQGGSSGNGTVFALNNDGTGFTTLYNFSGEGPSLANLIVSGNTLYGTCQGGSVYKSGTVFAINTDGTGFTTLHTFSALNSGTNSDGANPRAPLVQSGNTLYGTTLGGGSFGQGTVFAINSDGTGFSVLHSFTGGSDGANGGCADCERGGGLALSGSALYGTTARGGSSGNGTVFAVKTDGTGFTTLHSFTSTTPSYTNTEGAAPLLGLVLSGNTLYGMTISGGGSGNGTIFSISFKPQLTITPSGPNIILTWPTNFAGFDYTGYTLESTMNLGPSAVWVSNSVPPVIVNGQNTVTNAISGAQQFFRLSQ